MFQRHSPTEFFNKLLGARGMLVACCDGTVLHCQARARLLSDVTGAGDTVLAVLGLALAAGVEAGAAVWLSNLAAGLVVEKPGTGVVSADEIIDHLQRTRQDTSFSSLLELRSKPQRESTVSVNE